MMRHGGRDIDQKISRVGEWMAASGVSFGTSGARGLVSAMTDQLCHAYATGFLAYLREAGHWQPGQPVAFAGDLRPSTPRIMAACAQAIRDMGGEPKHCGTVPTPALAAWALFRRMPCLMVTGSHIPDDRNGIKFYRPDGELLKSDEAGIMRQIIAQDAARFGEAGQLLDPAPFPPAIDVISPYVARYVDVFGSEALRGRRLAVYQHSAVGRDMLVQLLTSLGAEVTALGRSEQFVPVDTEAVREEDQQLARQWAAERRFDAIVSTDGDSDRPLLADETGEWLRGDVLGILCARLLGADVVVTPVSSNSLVERMPEFGRIVRTRIGSPFVIKAMNDALTGASLVCGYEANGGFLLASEARWQGRSLAALPTRDAALPIVAALVAAGSGGLSAMVKALPPGVTHSDRLAAFAPDRRDALMAWLNPPGQDAQVVRLNKSFKGIAGEDLTDVNLVDGVRMRFANARVIHLRGSGNSPELRCYTEAETPEVAAALNRAALSLVSEMFPA